jgi:hypothetical protein
MEMSKWLRTGAFNEKDEYYTPKILVDAILPYIPEDKTVWCPFDTKDSEFVHAISSRNKVVYSHIWEGKDFFDYEPGDYDLIVSNPPFTRKLEVLNRLYNLNKPFAMVLPLPMLNYQEVGDFFLNKELQLLIVNKKVSFDGNTASFNNSYFCHKMLPKDLIFCGLEHNNSRSYYVPSRMKKTYNDQAQLRTK